jgi:hypothetical protein
LSDAIHTIQGCSGIKAVDERLAGTPKTWPWKRRICMYSRNGGVGIVGVIVIVVIILIIAGVIRL